MTKFLKSAGLMAVAALCVSALPSQAGTVITFGNNGTNCSPTSGTCGTVSVTGSTLTSMTVSDLTQFTLAVTGFATSTWSLASTDTLGYSGGTWTLTGSATCVSNCFNSQTTAGGTGITLFTFSNSTTPNTPTVTGSGPYGIALTNASTTLSEQPTIASELDLTAPTGTNTATADFSGITGSGAAKSDLTASQTFYVDTNQSIAATPEPASFLLFGTGLAALAFFSRRRMTKAAIKA